MMLSVRPDLVPALRPHRDGEFDTDTSGAQAPIGTNGTDGGATSTVLPTVPIAPRRRMERASAPPL